MSFATPEELRGSSTAPDEEPSGHRLESSQRSQSQAASPAVTWSTLGSQQQNGKSPTSQPQQEQREALQSFSTLTRTTSNSLYEQAAAQQREARLSSSANKRPNLGQDNDHQSPEVGSASMVFSPISVSSPIYHQIRRTPGQSTISPWPFESRHEASLFLHFVNTLSYWVRFLMPRSPQDLLTDPSWMAWTRIDTLGRSLHAVQLMFRCS